MRTLAAVAVGPGRALEVREIEVAPPGPEEVLVEVAAAAVGPADRLTLSGRDGDGRFPCILGHEAAGRVVETGRDVRSVRPGDAVIPLVVPECGTCSYCLDGRTNLCQRLRDTQGRGVMPDGRPRFSADGEPIFHYMGVSAFSGHIVLPEISVARIDRDLPLDEMAVFCGPIATGMGAAGGVGRVRPGETVAVFGLGPIGLGVAFAAAAAGAARVIAVEPSARKCALARNYGVSDAWTPESLGSDPAAAIRNLTGGGTDVAFECVGDAGVMRQAVECTRKGWGRSVILGVTGASDMLAIPPVHFVLGRTVTGCAFGGLRGRSELHRYLAIYRDGRFPVAPLIGWRGGIEAINEALDASRARDLVRAVVAHDDRGPASSRSRQPARGRA